MEVSILFLALIVFFLKDLFESSADVETYQIEHCLPLFIKPKDGFSTMKEILLFRIIFCDIILFFGATYVIVLFVNFCFLSDICGDYFRTLSISNGKESFLGGCRDVSHFL